MRIWVWAALGMGLSGCGVDPEGSGVFGFSGTWSLTPATGLVAEPCELRINNSEGSARCDGNRVIFESEQERLEEQITLNAELTVTETRIGGSGIWTRADTYEFDGQRDGRTCILTWSGSAEREEGRQTDGRFSALAGQWEGTARYSAECDGRQVMPDTDLVFTGDLFGQSAEIRWRELGEVFENLVVVQHADGVGVSIDGVDVPEL